MDNTQASVLALPARGPPLALASQLWNTGAGREVWNFWGLSGTGPGASQGSSALVLFDVCGLEEVRRRVATLASTAVRSRGLIQTRDVPGLSDMA